MSFPTLSQISNFKAIIWDLDNTIYPYEQAHQFALNTSLSLFAIWYKQTPNETNELYALARKRVHKQLNGQAASHSRLLYFKEMLWLQGATTHSDALLLENTYWKSFLKVIKINKEALAIIKKVNTLKINQYIITDLTTQIQLQKLKKLRIEHYFKDIITSEEAGVEKPNPIIFQFALNRWQLNANECCLIGDNEKTDGGAEKIGITTFLI